MIRNFKRTASVIGVVAASSVALVACSNDDSDTSAEGDNSSSDSSSSSEAAGDLSGTAGELVGEGASSQKTAMDYFGQKYSEAVDGASLAYTSSGSGSGQKQFIADQAVFAGSDSPLKDEQVDQAADRCDGNEAWHLPFVIGPVAIAYNVEGVDNLNLSVGTIAKIFKGDIKKWNDEAIAAENDGVELPDTDIHVVYRKDESGTTDNFQKFLKAVAPDTWESEGKVFPTTVGESAEGSSGVATQTQQVDGAITYVEAGYAQQQGLGIANIDFGSGPVEYNADAVNAALDNLEFKTEGHNMVVDAEKLFQQNDEGSYPLILTTYEIVCSAGYDEDTSNQVKDFLKTALKAQEDDQFEQLGYIPVEGTHHDRLEEAIDAIK